MQKKLLLICFLGFFSLNALAYNHYAFDLNASTKTVHANNFTYTLLPSGIVSVSHANNNLTNLGIALYGVAGSPNYLKSWDASWSWQVIENSDYNITVLGTTTYSGFTWKQEWVFQRYSKPKITHILTNNTGTTITDMKMYYVLDVNESVVSNVTYYDNQNQAHQFTFNQTPDYELNESIHASDGQLIFNAGNGAYFDFTDLFSDFTVNYVFAGNLNNALNELPVTQGLIIGFTKGNATMIDGQTIRVDPTFDDFEDNDYSGMWTYDESENSAPATGEEVNGYLKLWSAVTSASGTKNAQNGFVLKDADSFTFDDFPITIKFRPDVNCSSVATGDSHSYEYILMAKVASGYLEVGDVNIVDYKVLCTTGSSASAGGFDAEIILTHTDGNTIRVDLNYGGSYTKDLTGLGTDINNLRLKFNGEGTAVANANSASYGRDFRIYSVDFDPGTIDLNVLTPVANKGILSNRDYNVSWIINNQDANAVSHLFDLNYGLTSNPTTVILNDGNVASTPGLWCDSNNFSITTTCYYTWSVPDLNGDYYLKVYATNPVIGSETSKTVYFSMQDSFFLKVWYYDALNGSGVKPDSWVITGTDYISYCDANGLCFIPDLNGWPVSQRSITANLTGADSNVLQPVFGESQEFEGRGALTLRRTTITLINEDNGNAWNPPADFNADDDSHIINVIMYDINGAFLYDFNASGNYYSITVPDNTKAYNFEITYNNAGQQVKYKKEIILGLINDTNSKICVAPLQNFYEQIFTSTQEKQIIVYLPISDCYALAGTLRNLYGETQFNNVYTINKTYQAYTYSDELQTFLAWVNGGTAYSHNLDSIEFNQTDITVTVGYDTLAFVPLINSVTGEDLNILQIYFKSHYGNYINTNLKIYSDSNGLLYELTEDINANEFVLNWDWNAYGFTDENVLHIIIVSTTSSGTTKLLTEYFTIKGNKFSGSKDPTFIAIMTILFFLFGITLTSIGKTFGWFGIVICVASMAISVMASPGSFFIPLIQAGLFICFLFVFLQGGGTKPIVGGIQ